MTVRFSKKAAIAYAQLRAEDMCERHGFDDGKGTAQLTQNEALQELVSRAVDYGRFRAFQEMAEDMEAGRLEAP